MIERIEQLRREAQAAIADAHTSQVLQELHVRYLGRKAELPQLLRGVAQLDPAERAAVGRAANEARQALEALLQARERELSGAELHTSLAHEQIDVTLPGSPPQPVGRLHVLTQTMRELQDIFLGIGFTVLEGPEVETVHYNFDALNHSPTHPARARTDTFYVDVHDRPDGERLGAGAARAGASSDGDGASSNILLRTHTSPMQIRSMLTRPLPLYVVSPGRCYRHDALDATHSPVFHQIEGLAVDEGLTMADLRGAIQSFVDAMFGVGLRTRLRPDYFPFTEPSGDVSMECHVCRGASAKPGGDPCRVCRSQGWIEIAGCGMVNPRVLVACGIDPDRYSGFAFGLGIERSLMIGHGVTDIKDTLEGDVRFSRAFGMEI
jgi:phenylalanyl-tRNA synthetase alpha chain